MKHTKAEVPAYKFTVNHRPPSLKSSPENKQKYAEAVKSAAASCINSPITSNDIEVEICWSTSVREGMRADIDNIIKPTLDALIQVAFIDDKLVRSVTSTLFDMKQPQIVSGRVEDMGGLFYSNNPDVVQITIYSDRCLQMLGGAEKVNTQRREQYFTNFPQIAERHITQHSRWAWISDIMKIFRK
jgi:Holliday junction resolvase RusA-like endonuclease